jgi:Family of unknown function (DUF6529)
VAVGVLAFAVAAALYVFGRVHTPNYAVSLFGLSGIRANLLKAELGTAMLGLSIYQLVLALWMYGRLPGVGPGPARVHFAHRAGGILVFLLSLPIAYHCITAYGVQLTTARVTLHSLAGCFFYGAFVAKMVIVRSRYLPGLALPLAGGTLITLIAVLWYTAALWQLNGFSAPGL